MEREQISRELAERCLAAVKAQFSAYIEPGVEDGPVLYEPGTQAEVWSIGWESGPDNFADLAFVGGHNEEIYTLARPEATAEQARQIAQQAPGKLPKGVHVEAYYSWLITLTPSGE